MVNNSVDSKCRRREYKHNLKQSEEFIDFVIRRSSWQSQTSHIIHKSSSRTISEVAWRLSWVHIAGDCSSLWQRLISVATAASSAFVAVSPWQPDRPVTYYTTRHGRPRWMLGLSPICGPSNTGLARHVHSLARCGRRHRFWLLDGLNVVRAEQTNDHSLTDWPMWRCWWSLGRDNTTANHNGH